jgi:hypothetical protein
MAGFIDFLVEHRQYAVMAATDPAAKRTQPDDRGKLVQRALTVLFGDHPSGADRLCFQVLFSLPECLPEVVDLTDEELREALQTVVLRLLRVPPGHKD